MQHFLFLSRREIMIFLLSIFLFCVESWLNLFLFVASLSFHLPQEFFLNIELNVNVIKYLRWNCLNFLRLYKWFSCVCNCSTCDLTWSLLTFSTIVADSWKLLRPDDIQKNKIDANTKEMAAYWGNRIPLLVPRLFQYNGINYC